MADLRRQRRDGTGAEGHRLSGVRWPTKVTKCCRTRKGGDDPGLGQKVARAARAATRTQRADSSDLADLPPMRKLFVRTGRDRSPVRQLPQPALTKTNKRRRKFSTRRVVRYCRTPSSITRPTYAQKRNLRRPTYPLLRCPPESGVNSSEDTQTNRARRKPPARCE